ncbi:MAG: baseplate J/gp47 family protein [Methylophilus sp.]
MSYTRPTFDLIKSRIKTDLVSMPSVLADVLSVVWAKVIHGLYGFLTWIDAQCSPLTCSLDRLYDWAALYSVNRLEPVKATGYVTVTGNIGATVLADTLLRGDNGLDYVVLQAVNLLAGDNLVQVRCQTAGAAGNLLVGAVLTAIDPIAGVNGSMAVGADGITGGAEIEDVDAWRTRVVEEWQVVAERGGRSGKRSDYKSWAKKAHPSVTGALVQPHVLGLGTVVVRPICNGLLNRLPTPAIIDAIALKFNELAPATADWRVVEPQLHAIEVRIDLFAGIDSAQNRADILQSVNNLILSESSEGSVLAMAELDAAIASVTTQYTRLAPLNDIAVNSGSVFILSGIVFS